MIREITIDPSQSVARIEVLSNLSLTLDRLAGVFLALSCITLLVALLPTIWGYWPVMVIAIIHLAIVGWCFRLAWRGNWARQDITIDAEQVCVETRTARGGSASRWPAGWVRVHEDRVRGEPRVRLGLHGQMLEIGRFVPPQERAEAARLIRRALMPHSAWSHSRLQDTASSE
jgi:uncharacterized membrane protein